VSRFYGVEGNEQVDVLAKQTACLDFVGPKADVGLSVYRHMLLEDK